MSSLHISAVVCTYNEDSYLRECLLSLRWADEIIVCDMGSTDRTLQIARECKVRIESIPRVEFVEAARAQAVSFCAHAWICFTDPDFVFPAHRIDELKEVILKDPGIACINMRYVNYFCGTQIRHGAWGTRDLYPILFRKDAMELRPILHSGFALRSGESFTAPAGCYLKHFWIKDEAHFYRKHQRYILNEGVARLARGDRPSLKRIIRHTRKAFVKYLFGGIVQGALGFDLFRKSLWYEYESERQFLLDYLTHRPRSRARNSPADSPRIRACVIDDGATGPVNELISGYCMRRTAENPGIESVCVVTSSGRRANESNVRSVRMIVDPGFGDVLNCVFSDAQENDITILLRWDSFIDESDMRALHALGPRRVCFVEGLSIRGISILRPRIRPGRVVDANKDVQGAWILRGRPSHRFTKEMSRAFDRDAEDLREELVRVGYEIEPRSLPVRVYSLSSTFLKGAQRRSGGSRGG